MCLEEDRKVWSSLRREEQVEGMCAGNPKPDLLCFLPSDLPPPATRERPPGCKTVFVGGLPENGTEQIIMEVFEQCGEVIAIRKSKKNFCHIRFAEEFMVDKALYLSGGCVWLRGKLTILGQNCDGAFIDRTVGNGADFSAAVSVCLLLLLNFCLNTRKQLLRGKAAMLCHLKTYTKHWAEVQSLFPSYMDKCPANLIDSA